MGIKQIRDVYLQALPMLPEIKLHWNQVKSKSSIHAISLQTDHHHAIKAWENISA